MSSIADNLRKQAAEQRAASAPLLGESDFDVDPKKQALFIIGQISGNVFQAVADAIEAYGAGAAEESPIMQARKRVLERNNAIRIAAAKEDWNEFDRLVAGGTVEQ